TSCRGQEPGVEPVHGAGRVEPPVIPETMLGLTSSEVADGRLWSDGSAGESVEVESDIDF
ncbi:hypothetical protein J6590_011238, partial [Homalodisca vitripennis]